MQRDLIIGSGKWRFIAVCNKSRMRQLKSSWHRFDLQAQHSSGGKSSCKMACNKCVIDLDLDPGAQYPPKRAKNLQKQLNKSIKIICYSLKTTLKIYWGTAPFLLALGHMYHAMWPSTNTWCASSHESMLLVSWRCPCGPIPQLYALFI
jgi:hypothetical protein